jgi:predicted RNA-binding Zn-ribbon protein involved in translation (DUF1610 family)
MKKYCEKCGLRHDLPRKGKDQFKCEECGHVNLTKAFKLLRDKTSYFEPCPQCQRVVLGKIIRKINNTVTILYKCSDCNYEWSEKWEQKPLKEKIKGLKK